MVLSFQDSFLDTFFLAKERKFGQIQVLEGDVLYNTNVVCSIL